MVLSALLQMQKHFVLKILPFLHLTNVMVFNQFRLKFKKNRGFDDTVIQSKGGGELLKRPHTPASDTHFAVSPKEPKKTKLGT